MNCGRRTVAGWSLIVCLLGFATGGRSAPQSSLAPSISRADFAAAYLRFETAFLAAAPDEAETARVNRAFDALTLAFFSRNYSAAIEQLDHLTASLDPKGAGMLIPELGAYRSRFTPAVYSVGSGQPSLAVDILYEPGQPVDGLMVTLRLKRADPTSSIDIPLELTFPRDRPVLVSARLEEMTPKLRPGRYEVGFSAGPLFFLHGSWAVVSKPLDPRSAANAARLAKIETASPALLQAAAAVSARNKLLSDLPDPQNTAQMLFDPEVLAAEVEAEVAALEKGRDPFAGRTGDYWRVLQIDDRSVPLRVYRPASVPAGKTLPLVVAFHGSGGDENMFMDAYGAGLIKRLADKYQFLAVSPFTNAFGGMKGAETFDRMIEAIAYDYPIDRSRIYVVGHSMGAMTAAALAAARPAAIAAAACLCGFSGFKDGVETVPPTLIVAGELDPIASPARIEPAFQKARAAGLPVEYRFLKNYGHTLAVTNILPEAVGWLLARSR